MHNTLIALGLAILCWLPCALGAEEQAITERQLQQLERSITKLQKKLSKARDEHSDIEQQLKQSETAIGQLALRIQRSERQRQALEQDLAQAKQQRSSLQGARQQQEVLIAAQLRRAFQLGRDDAVKILLNQQDPAQLARTMTYLGYVNRARMAQIAEFSRTIAQLSATEASIIDNAAALNSTLAQLTEQQSALRQQHRSRETALKQLALAISSDHAHLKQQQKNRDALEKLLLTVEDVSQDIASSKDGQPFAARKGKMAWPVKGKRSNRFGARRSKGGLQWEGIEIRAKQGTPVHAIHQGRVLFADWFRGQGLLIILDHGDGYLSLYSHNHSLLHATGDWVNAGEAIATVGASGGRDHSALYFEIRHQSKAQNPAKWCRH